MSWNFANFASIMIIASQKKKENIAEYLLYMWQIEDIIRAYGLDIDRIQSGIIDKYVSIDETQRKAMREWYESLIDMMRRENVVQSGHLQLNKNVILSLTDLHNRLMQDSRFVEYNAEFYKVLPFIVELRAKQGEEKSGEIESCFNALYGILMLRLQGKEISKETTDAAAVISRFLAMLSALYKKDFENQLFTEE